MMNLCGDARFLVSKGAKVILRRMSVLGHLIVETDEVVESNYSNPITVTVMIIQQYSSLC
jgi:hypothetical protein